MKREMFEDQAARLEAVAAKKRESGLVIVEARYGNLEAGGAVVGSYIDVTTAVQCLVCDDGTPELHLTGNVPKSRYATTLKMPDIRQIRTHLGARKF